MPPLLIDLRRTDDSRDVVHRAVQALAEGQAVALPTETDYVVAVSARHPAATALLRRLAAAPASEPPLCLALKSADEALDWAPTMPAAGRRLSRRCWPGPVALIVADDHAEGLVRRLPAGSREALVEAGRLRLRVPGHSMIADCLSLLAGPVALVEPAAAGQPPAVTASEVVERAGQSLALVIDDGRTRYAQPVSTIELVDGALRLVRPGVLSEEAMRRLASFMVLFVCTGNTCRSPMAEAIFRQLVAERLGCGHDEVEGRGIVIVSAGLAAWGGGPASPAAQQVAEEYGTDLSSHASQPVTESLVRQADLILTMTAAHRDALVAQFPEAAGRTAMLAPDRRDVLDPIGGPLETYRRCAAQIAGHLAARMATLAADLPG